MAYFVNKSFEPETKVKTFSKTGYQGRRMRDKLKDWVCTLLYIK